ncbi:MAG: PAS domain-containing protein [Candidatus Thermoplasmatota archaeon]|nr:PAS domain-containing protein [Candidatus Thermoplasmatota archaeon]
MAAKENGSYPSYSSKDKHPLKSLEIIDDGSMGNTELLLEACPFAIILVDIDGKVFTLNTKMASIFQLSKKELIGKSIFPLLELNARERRKQIAHHVFHEKKPYIFEDYERGLWWRTTILPIKDTNGNVIKIAGIIENIVME